MVSGNKPHILCVSWDSSLAQSRERLFQHYGCEVTSAKGRHEAIERCKTKADLLVLGHSVPQEEKRKIIHCYRMANDSPVLSLLRPGEVKLAEAEYGIEYMNPELLMSTVHWIVPISLN